MTNDFFRLPVSNPPNKESADEYNQDAKSGQRHIQDIEHAENRLEDAAGVYFER